MVIGHHKNWLAAYGPFVSVKFYGRSSLLLLHLLLFLFLLLLSLFSFPARAGEPIRSTNRSFYHSSAGAGELVRSFKSSWLGLLRVPTVVCFEERNSLNEVHIYSNGVEPSQPLNRESKLLGDHTRPTFL